MNRKSNFELLRIIAMFLIVVYHFSDWGGLIHIYNINPVNSLFGIFINSFGKLGVNLFVLISGYFLINSKFNSKKILKLILQVFVYSCAIVFVAINIFKLNVKPIDISNSFFPLSNNIYWFATSYIILYMLAPFLNGFLKSLSEQNYKKLIIVLIIIFSIIPTLKFNGAYSINNTIWIFVIYIIGAYIKLYGINLKKLNNKGYNILITIILILTLFTLNIICFKLGIGLSLNNQYSIILLILSIVIFEFYRNLNIKENKIINYLASSCFAVYLIHMNKLTLPYILAKILYIPKLYDENLIVLVLHVFISALIIFFISIFIDKIRLLLEKILFKLFELIKLDKFFIKIDKKLNLEEEK